jgi:hypothetical protein
VERTGLPVWRHLCPLRFMLKDKSLIFVGCVCGIQAIKVNCL